MTKAIFEESFNESQNPQSNQAWSDLEEKIKNLEIPAFVAGQVDSTNPNHLAILFANDKFYEIFKQSEEKALDKSYDYLFDNVDVNYSSEDQLEYIRLIKSVKEKENCSVIKKLDSYYSEVHEIARFKIDFEAIKNHASGNFYAIFKFEKLSEEIIESDEISTKQESIKTQNQTLVKNLERALKNEKLLREISYLIISDKPVKDIAKEVAMSLCKLLKVERCIIHDYKNSDSSFVVEYDNYNAKSITENESTEFVERYIHFQHNFYQKFRKKESSDEEESLFIANDVKSDQNFDKLMEFHQNYGINSQIFAITSFDKVVNGGIIIHSSQNMDLTIDEMELIELINDQLSIAIDRSNSIEKVMIANHNLLSKTLELKESIRKEKEMRKMQTEFVALVSHEFKTPLQIIDSTRELIARKVNKAGINDENFEKYFERIKSAVKRTTGLIDSTLDLAKMENENNKIEIQKQSFDIHELIHEIIDRTSDLALRKNVSVKVDLMKNGENDKIEFYGDRKLLDHCFSNIISNAIKYSKENGLVKIISKFNEKTFALRVMDNGIGIPKEDVEKIGNKFFRAKNTLEVSGTGIGIYLTKHFIDLHEGEVKIDSELNVGTSFTVILPRKINENEKNS